MAHITLAGVLRDPTGEFAVGDEIKFTHLSTTGETINSAVSPRMEIPPNGAYSIELQYGLVLVEYKDIRKNNWKDLGVATVNATNPATSIPELLNATVPVSSAELIEFQAILADCVTAQTAAESAETNSAASAVSAASSAASIDADNLSFEFSSVQNMELSTTAFTIGKKISTGSGRWRINNSNKGVLLASGLYANPLNGVWVSDFGLDDTGLTSTSIGLQRACDIAENFTLNVTEGTFLFSANVDVRSNTKINGLGGTFKLGGHEATFRCWGVENVVIDGLNIDGNLPVWTNFGQYTLPIVGCDNVTVKYCHIYNGQNAGIGVGQQLAPDYNKNINILYNHIHDIGIANHPNFTSYGNGVAVTGGEDITIEGNNIHDIHQVGFVNLEGTLLKNIRVINNTCYHSTGRAAGIKCVSFGVDVPADNIIIRDNTLYEIGKIGDPDAANTEPTIWIEAGAGVTAYNNTIRDCPAVGKAGVFEVTSGAPNTRVIDNKIFDCDGGRFFLSGSTDLVSTGNEVKCTATTTLTDSIVPFYVETNSGGEGAAIVNHNLVKDAPYTSYIFNPASSGDFTSNRLVRPNRVGGSYTIRSLTGFKFSRQGGNTIVHDGGEVIGVATYNFSGGGHQDMEYLPDIWNVPDLSLITKFDVGSNNYYIESSVGVKAGSNPAPTLGYNQRGRSIKTANPQSGLAPQMFCTVAGVPGVWVGVALP